MEPTKHEWSIEVFAHPHTHACVHTHTCTRTHTHTYTYARTHTRTRARTHTHQRTKLGLPYRCSLKFNASPHPNPTPIYSLTKFSLLDKCFKQHWGDYLCTSVHMVYLAFNVYLIKLYKHSRTHTHTPIQ